MAFPLALDADLIVDTEANLNPVVLQKIMFRLGLDHNLVDAWTNDINQLLGRRNSVAHGDHRTGLQQKSYEILEAAVLGVVDSITRLLFDATVREAHRKAMAPPA